MSVNYGRVIAHTLTHQKIDESPVPAHGTITFTPMWRVDAETTYVPTVITGHIVDGVLKTARTGGVTGLDLVEGEYIVEGSFTAVSGTRLKAFTSVSVKAGETVSLSGWLTDQVGKQPSMYGIPATEAISIDPNLDERVRKIVQEFSVNGVPGAPSTANRRNQKDGAGWYIRATKCAFVECEAQENGGHGFIVAYGDNVLSECRAESSSYKGTVTAPAKINEASDFYVLNEGTDGTVLNACTSRSARKADGGARWSYYVETWFKGLAIVNCVSRDVATPSGWTGVPVRTRSPQGDDVFIQVNNYMSTTRPGQGPVQTGSKTWNLTHATTKTTSNGAERCYVQVDNLTGFGLIHMDFTYRGNFANDEKLFTWPADAPAPAGLIETQLIPGQAGQIYATVGDRSVKSWDIPLQEGRHVIVNLVGFFTKS